MSSPQFRVFKYTLQAEEVQTIHRPANTAICLKASEVFEIAFDDQPLTDFQQGLSYETIGGFKKVQIKNNSTNVLTVELGLASGGIRDARLSIEGGIIVEQRGGASLDDFKIDALTVARTLVVAARAARNEITITNLGTDTVYIGGNTVADKTGQPVGAGSTATLETTAELHVFNPSGATVELSCLELYA